MLNLALMEREGTCDTLPNRRMLLSDLGGGAGTATKKLRKPDSPRYRRQTVRFQE